MVCHTLILGMCQCGVAAEQAKVVKEVDLKVEKMTVVRAEKSSDLVAESPRKVNRTAADGFVKFRIEKYEKEPSKHVRSRK